MMKSKVQMIIAVFILMFIVGVAGAQNNFEQSKDWTKLEPAAQDAWNSYKKTGQSFKIECFLVLSEIADQGDQSFLFSAGFSTEVATGSVVRGHMQVSALPNVANQYFVRKINLAN